MNNQTEEDIIQEYEQSRKQIRAVIAEYQATEHRLFKIMLDKLNALNNKDPRTASFDCQYEDALD